MNECKRGKEVQETGNKKRRERMKATNRGIKEETLKKLVVRERRINWKRMKKNETQSEIKGI